MFKENIVELTIGGQFLKTKGGTHKKGRIRKK